jgi:hypothetical protein
MWRKPEIPPQPQKQLAFQLMLEYMQQFRSTYYAVTDAARDEAVLPFIEQNPEIAHCLYRGDTAIRLARYAPYLFRIDLGDPAIRRFLAAGWGQGGYILLSSTATLQDILTQLRKNLIVRSEAQEHLYFRFYDPRVLRGYLPLCGQGQLAKLMGEVIETLFCESHDARDLAVCRAHLSPFLRRIGGAQRDYRLSQFPLIENTLHG